MEKMGVDGAAAVVGVDFAAERLMEEYSEPGCYFDSDFGAAAVVFAAAAEE